MKYETVKFANSIRSDSFRCRLTLRSEVKCSGRNHKLPLLYAGLTR
jgi:hypothetical protein